MLARSSCAFCRVKFTPEEKARGWKVHFDCIGPYAESSASRLARKKQAKAKQTKALEARELRAKKEKFKRLSEFKDDAQRSFNAFTRWRDRLGGFGCISCPRPLDWSGNQVDAGHYRSIGAAAHLRYDERNVHAQCKYCNHRKAGNAVDYRLGLIERIGLEAVQALEADNAVHKWTRDELVEIRDTYRAKLKELRNAKEHDPHPAIPDEQVC